MNSPKPKANPSTLVYSPLLGLSTELTAICNDATKPLASLAVLSVRAGQVAYSGGFGRAQMGGAGRPDVLAGSDTLYRVASISKLITSLGVMRMLERGQLTLDADVSEVLGWSLRNPNFPDTAITLRMLLSHTSSLRDDANYYWEAGKNIRDVLQLGGALHGKGAMWGKNAEPGAYFQYANLPWGVIGTVMERASGKRFDLLMHELVFVPLGIEGGFNPAAFPADQLKRLATLYRKRSEVSGKEVWNPAGPWVPQVDDYSSAAPVPRAGPSYVIGSNGTVFGPQGGARLSANGLGVVLRMLLANGQVLDGASGGRALFLKPETVALMLSSQWRMNEAAGGQSSSRANGDSYGGLMRAWGLGVQHFTDVSVTTTKSPSGDRLIAPGGYRGMGHLGNAWGLTSALVLDPSTQSGMVFLVGGPGFNPDASDPGRYSSLFGYEERILTALHRYSIEF